jgi:NTE family protein
MYRKIVFLLLILALYNGLLAIRVGYALSGGGARGFAHIGMLKVIEEKGIRPSYISGTSIGALIGGLYAMGYNATEIESIFVNVNWESFFSDDWKRDELYIGQKRWAPYGNAFFRMDDNWTPQLPQSVITGNKINLELFKMFSPATDVNSFDSLPIPFSCIATDLVSGSQFTFNEGSLMQSIRASMSLPSLLQPFPLNNTLYIDGGISQNLPGKQVKDMGADFIIGFKVNSALRDEKKLNGIIQVLDQTINIGITNNLKEQLTYCDFVFEPDLEGISATRFGNVSAAIRAGENYAREHIDELLIQIKSLDDEDLTATLVNRLQSINKYYISRINVEGNEYLSAAKIREYTGLTSDFSYSSEEIAKAMHQAWNSQLFDIIYPVLTKDNECYILTIVVKERERKYLALNMAYDRDNEFVTGAVLSLHNYYLKNSHLFAEVKMGGKHELNIDVVKNFGDAYGIYYRIFPYINEKRIYFYNSNHEKATSARSLEYGLTTGIGLFAKKAVVLESYTYTYHTKLYREIAVIDTLGKSLTISGIGVKAYHESLDDFVFPTKGLRVMLKSSFAKKDIMSDKTINRLNFDCTVYHPMGQAVSTILGLQYGSHFKDNIQSSWDPFYLGGLDCFAGFQHYELSAPYYRLAQGGIIFNHNSRLYLTAKLQVIEFSHSDSWINANRTYTGGVFDIGYKTIFLGPTKFSVALTKDRPAQFYVNIGYNYDIFHFSRK